MLRSCMVFSALTLIAHGASQAQEFDFGSAGPDDLVQEWIQRASEPGRTYVHVTSYITGLIASGDSRADGLLELVVEELRQGRSDRIARSAALVLVRAEDRAERPLTGPVSQVFRSLFTDELATASKMVDVLSAGSTPLRAQILGWVTPMIAQGEVGPELEESLASALPLLGPQGLQA